MHVLIVYLESVPKGGNDRPTEEVIIADCGEVCFICRHVQSQLTTFYLQLDVEARRIYVSMLHNDGCIINNGNNGNIAVKSAAEAEIHGRG